MGSWPTSRQQQRIVPDEPLGRSTRLIAEIWDPSGPMTSRKEFAMTVLVTGATGNIGSLVVERLLTHGQRPRVFVRDEAKARERFSDRVEVVVGDLADSASLESALEGVDQLFLVSTGYQLQTRDEAAAKAARLQGVKRLVKLSSMDARQGVGSGVFHAIGEQAIRASGINFVFVQPAGFMTNALGWATAIKQEGVVRSCTDEGRIAFIHPRDIAEVATTVLLTDAYDGVSLPITGPEALSYGQMAAKIAAVIGRPVSFLAISEEEAREEWIATGESPRWVAEVDLPIWRAMREGRLAEVTDNVRLVTGRSPITFDEWVEENQNLFG